MMNDEELRAEREKLATERREAEDRLLQAQTTQTIVKEDHDKLTGEMVDAVTPEDRSALQGQLAEHAEKLRNANATLRERQSEVNAIEEREVEAEEFQERMETTADRAENVAEIGSETFNELAHVEQFDLGGTSRPVGEAVSWAKNVTIPYVRDVGGVGNAIRIEVEKLPGPVNVSEKLQGALPDPVNVSEKLQGVVDAFAAKEKKEEELSDDQKLKKENEAHEKNVSQLNDLEGKISSELEKDDSQKNIGKLIKETQNVIKEQDKRTLDSFEGHSFEGNLANDPAAREQQFQNRSEHEREINAKRYEVVNELLTPIAEQKVLDQHFQIIEKEAANNNNLLQMNEKRLGDRPDAKSAQEKYEVQLNDELAAKEKALDARWAQNVQQELGGLRREHFPEVRPPEMEGPALTQPSPSQAGPGGGFGGGSAMAPQQSGPGGAVGGGAPQQQGPAGPAM
jgi:hypothetical protein